MENELTSVHQALQQAALEDSKQAANAMATASFRIDKELIEKSQEICSLNGTTLSGFLRQCVIGLVNDYRS